ncbi:MAG: hypothetical protein LBI72_14670 [Flavobacteriaceae bacterium]|jgi:hypothetical protein|nr:hypothetical protein [Flavobacteriaceae bacterium]
MSNKVKKASVLFSVCAIAVAIGFYFSSNKKETKTTEPLLVQNNYGTYSNPELAYKECHKILTDLSKTINTSKNVTTHKQK